MSSYATNLPPTRISSHLMAFDPNTPAEDVAKIVAALPELPPRFFIPRLDDRPQNPIMDTLRILQKKPHNSFIPAPAAPSLPSELALLSEDLLKAAQVGKSNLEDIWRSAVQHRHGHMVSSSCTRVATCYKDVGSFRIVSFHGMHSACPLIRTRILPPSSRNSLQTALRPLAISECCIVFL